jgi:hypothetical protein
MSLVFFLSFFLYGASLFENFFESFFGVIYLAFLFSFVFYVYYFLRTKFVSKIKGALALILISILASAFVLLSLPVVFR